MRLKLYATPWVSHAQEDWNLMGASCRMIWSSFLIIIFMEKKIMSWIILRGVFDGILFQLAEVQLTEKPKSFFTSEAPLWKALSFAGNILWLSLKVLMHRKGRKFMIFINLWNKAIMVNVVMVYNIFSLGELLLNEG